MRISALALLKMAMHAKSGGNIEIMGMLQARPPPLACREGRYHFATMHLRTGNTASATDDDTLMSVTWQS